MISGNSFWISPKTNVTFDKIVFDGITDALALTTEACWKKGEICPNLDILKLPEEEALMKFFKISLRGDLRRQIRRLTEELGELALIEYTSFDEIPPETFETFMHHQRLRWPNAYKAPYFHENLLKSGLKAECVHFSVLMAGNTEVAWHLGFEWNGRYYYYMPAGNQKYLKFSPVKVHLFYLVKRAIDRNLEVFDHLRGEENYKQGWSDGHQYVNTLTIIADNPISKIKNRLVNLKNKI